MKYKILFILLATLFFIQNANACDINIPCIDLRLNANSLNIGCDNGGAPAACANITLRASTSFDPAPTTTPPCDMITGCWLEIQDCNGSLAECNDTTTTTPDWNGIPADATFENDITCGRNCRRDGAIEDTVFSAIVTGLESGSRYFRACWYDGGVIIVCSDYQRVHWYSESSALNVGQTACRPTNNNVTRIKNNTCILHNHITQYSHVPNTYWLDNFLILENSTLILDGVSLDFNFYKPNMGIFLDATSRIIVRPYAEYPAWTDMGAPLIDTNITYFGRFGKI